MYHAPLPALAEGTYNISEINCRMNSGDSLKE